MRAALLLLLLLAACGRTGAAPSEDRIKFSHGAHLRSGARCLDCHGEAVGDGGLVTGDASVAPGDGGAPRVVSGLPREAQCRRCHTAPEQQRCGYCHTEPRAPRTWRRADRALVFEHQSHVARLSGGCVRCHGFDADTDSAARFEPRIPEMAVCTDACHARDMRAMDCARCHRSLARYSPESLSLVRHSPGFARRHSIEARADARLCAQCHAPSYCARCHSASTGVPLSSIEPIRGALEFIHPGDWVARHPSEARLDQSSCVRCHAVEACDGCHRARGVGGSVAPGSVHGPGWLDPFSPRGHARAARRDLLTCVACHEQDATRTCVPCHRVGAAAGNPHPPGFAAGLDPQRHGVCLACHGAGP